MDTNKNTYGVELEPIINAAGDDALLFADKNGEIVVSAYKVFPGVTLTYCSVHSENPFRQKAEGGFLEICHCREGRIECEYENCFYYLTPGDLSIMASEKGFEKVSEFPVRHYHGVSILIETDCAPDCFSCFLSDVNVRLSDIIKKYCGQGDCCIERSNPYVDHIFSELYSVPQSIRKGYLKVKVLELLLYLTGAQHDRSLARKPCTTAQMKSARKICSYINDNIDRRVTIAELAEKFSISPSGIKMIFKNALGMSIYAYIRNRKMQTAAFLLRNSDISVMEIALRCGYSNPSKFSNAFREVIGVLPKEYRLS